MKKIYFYNKQREKIVGILYKKKINKGIIICHGFEGSKDRDFIPQLAKRLSKKYNVMRFDFSGNGESEGRFEDQSYSKYIEELNVAINYLKNLKINEIIVIGHSLGTNITIFEETKHKNIDKLILLAPAIYVTGKIFKSTTALLALIKGHIKFIDSWGKKRKLKRRFFFERILYDPIKNIKKIKKPIFMILGERDRVIDLKKSINLCKKININYNVVKGSGHCFTKEMYLNDMTNNIMKWIR